MKKASVRFPVHAGHTRLCNRISRCPSSNKVGAHHFFLHSHHFRSFVKINVLDCLKRLVTAMHFIETCLCLSHRTFRRRHAFSRCSEEKTHAWTAHLLALQYVVCFGLQSTGQHKWSNGVAHSVRLARGAGSSPAWQF